MSEKSATIFYRKRTLYAHIALARFRNFGKFEKKKRENIDEKRGKKGEGRNDSNGPKGSMEYKGEI